jgi:hypothetical protein
VLAAYAGSSYSAWVAQRYADNSQSAHFKVCNQDCEADKISGADCIGGCEKAAYAGWYQKNLALTRYPDRQWRGQLRSLNVRQPVQTQAQEDAWLLARTQTILTGGRKSTGKIFRPLLISILVGGVLGGGVHLILPTLSWFSGVEVAWAVVFGASFTPTQSTRRGIAA